MTDKQIEEAMLYCYETKPADCSLCPISQECRTIDADTLGEIFIIHMQRSTMSKEEYDDIRGKRRMAEQSI